MSEKASYMFSSIVVLSLIGTGLEAKCASGMAKIGKHQQREDQSTLLVNGLPSFLGMVDKFKEDKVLKLTVEEKQKIQKYKYSYLSKMKALDVKVKVLNAEIVDATRIDASTVYYRESIARMGRLKQMVTLLQLESISTIKEILKPEQIKRLLVLSGKQKL